MPGSPIAFDVYLDAITATVGALPEIESARRSSLVTEEEPGPFALVDVAALDTGKALASNEWRVEAGIEITILSPKSSRGSELDAMLVGHAVATACRWATWGLEVDGAQVRRLARDDFHSLSAHYEVVVVELVQNVVFWTAPDPADAAVSLVMVGQEPDVGTGHEADYDQVYPEP